jgi:hypothetical protein
VRGRIGQGNVYTFAVSARDNFSNLPKRFVFIVLVRRMMTTHLAQVGQPLSSPAFTPLRLQLPPGVSQIIGPDGTRHRLPPAADLREPRTFDHTTSAGIYRIDPPPGEEVGAEEGAPEALPVAAVNVPPSESSLDRLDEGSISNIESILGQTLFVSAVDDDGPTGGPNEGARATFPLAVLAMLTIGAATVMAWYMDRPVSSPHTETEETT